MGHLWGNLRKWHDEAFVGHIFHRRNELAEKTVSDPKAVQHWEMVHVFCSISIIDVYVGYLVKR